VVITISTYTEPLPVTTVNEPPYVHETEENDEHGAFAELLAGLLQKTDTQNTAENEVSGIDDGIDILAAEKGLFFTQDDAKIPVKAEKDISEIGIPNRELFDEELLNTDFSEEQLNFLSSAEHLLNRSNTIVNDGDIDGEVSYRLSKAEIAANLIDAKSVKANTAENGSLAQNAETEFSQHTAAISEESLPVETNGKKDRALHKLENNEIRPVDGNRNEELAALRKEPEKNAPNRLEEARNRSRRDKLTFDVRDFRTTDVRLNAGLETRVQGESSTREITLELRLPNQGQSLNSPTQAQTTWETKASSALENMLARELHQNFNGDIVRHASMALRDGGAGTIKLALKPESLGNVKIHLEMTENKITGFIVVESEEAFNAFRKEIASLEQAFKDSGYASADLNLSLAQDGKNADGQEKEADSFTPRNVASRYDDAFEQDSLPIVDVFFGRRQGAINMFA